MKDGLLYLFFVVCALILLSSKQSDIHQSSYEKSSIEFSIGSKNNVGIIPEFNFLSRKVEVISFLTFFYNATSDVTKAVSNNCLLTAQFKRYRAKMTGVRHSRTIAFRIKIPDINEKEDSYHLS